MESLTFCLRLQPQGLNAKIYDHQSCLYVLLESESLPSQEHLVSLVCQTLETLSVNSTYQLYIYGRSRKHFLPDWVQVLNYPKSCESKDGSSPSLYNNFNDWLARLPHQPKPIYLPSSGQTLNPHYCQLVASTL